MSNFAQSFEIPELSVQGQWVCLDSVLLNILHRHKTPDIFRPLFIETLSINTAFSLWFKEFEHFSIQFRDSNVLKSLISDCFYQSPTELGLRGYLNMDEEHEFFFQFKDGSQHLTNSSQFKFDQLISPEASIAVDYLSREVKNNYQGITEFVDYSMQASMRHYLNQSIQIESNIFTHHIAQENWLQGVAIILQKTPVPMSKIKGIEGLELSNHDYIYDPTFAIQHIQPKLDLLNVKTHIHEQFIHELFPQHHLVINKTLTITDSCTCNEAKIRDLLSQYPQSDRDTIPTVNGNIEVQCRFCNRFHYIDPKTLTSL